MRHRTDDPRGVGETTRDITHLPPGVNHEARLYAARRRRKCVHIRVEALLINVTVASGRRHTSFGISAFNRASNGWCESGSLISSGQLAEENLISCQSAQQVNSGLAGTQVVVEFGKRSLCSADKGVIRL